MSIALEIGARIGAAGFICGIGCVPIYESLEIEENSHLPLDSPSFSSSSSSSSSCSSIGKNSDTVSSDLEDDEREGMGEVQSSYRGLLQGMGSLEESLPIRRGISSFYNGKAKSFASLADAVAACASAKDLAKAENAHTRRRRNLLASKIFFEKHRSNLLRSPAGGIAKRPGAHKRCPLALAVAMNSSSRAHNIVEYEDECRPTVVVEDSVGSSSSLPLRSFSLGDLPDLKIPGSSIRP